MPHWCSKISNNARNPSNPLHHWNTITGYSISGLKAQKRRHIHAVVIWQPSNVEHTYPIHIPSHKASHQAHTQPAPPPWKKVHQQNTAKPAKPHCPKEVPMMQPPWDAMEPTLRSPTNSQVNSKIPDQGDHRRFVTSKAQGHHFSR